MFGNSGHFENSLFDELRRIQRDMDQLVEVAPWPSSIRAVGRGTYPPINVGSTADQLSIYLFVAGVDPNSLDISIQQNLLTIAGERRLVTEEGANYYRKERYDGPFHRVVTLPDDADPDRVEATYREGILHIVIQRRESARPRRIEVR